MEDFSQFTGQKQLPDAETRPQPEKEKAPTYFQKQKEQDGRSEWSGGSWGGRGK
jgi:hypothetical protein